MHPRFLKLLLIAGSLLAAIGPADAGDRLPQSQRAGLNGVQAELNLSAAEAGLAPVHQPIQIRLTLRDELSGEPLRGARPRMWLSRQGTEQPEPCAAQIRRFASGRLAQRADRDLNAFQVLTLNADASISVINPLLALNNTKLEALIKLPGVGTDWAHARGLDRLFVTLADRSELAVVDLTTHRLLKTLALGEGKPRRVVLGGDERKVWVAMDDSPRLLAVDTETLQVVHEVDVGAGVHNLVLADDGQKLVVTSAEAGLVTVVDTARGAVHAKLSVPGTPLSVTYSALGRRAYVGSLNQAVLSVVDVDAGRLLPSITLPHPASAVRADPSGRHVLAVNTASSRLMAIDAASGALRASADVLPQPDQIAFSNGFAYLRGLGSTSIQMVELRALDEGRIALNALPVFQKAPASAAEHIGPADMLAVAPEGDSMLLGSSTDTAIYYYTEGMMAPQGSYSTYNRATRAVRVVDRSLRETAPGVYTTSLRLERGGRYTLPLLVNEPRLVHCYALTVDETGATHDGRRIDVNYSWPAAPEAVRAGDEQTLTIRLKDAADGGRPLAGVRDLQLMVLERPGLSQQRQLAREREPGVYEVRQRFPRDGVWRLTVQSLRQGLSFDRSPWIDLKVLPADAPSAPNPATSTAPASPTPAGGS